MNKVYKLFFVVLIITTTTSCDKKFLDLAPASNANAEIFYKTKSDIDVAVNAAYSSLYSVYDPEGSVSFVSVGGLLSIYTYGHG